ncbi:MAG: DUF2380 domain-containing protein [Blastocatellales bacterium]
MNCPFLTGYERDVETSLDFAQARYYSNLLGRFTSVDPFDGSGFLGDPQSWNRYAYVVNQPTIATDPWGLLATKYYIDGIEATAEQVRAAIRGGWGIIAPAEITRWNSNLFNGQGGWEHFRATADGKAGWGYFSSVTTSSVVPETGEILQSATDVEWHWTQRLGSIVEWQGLFAFDTGVIRNATGGIIGERGLEMQMLGPLDYIGVGEAKVLAAGGVLLLKGGALSFGKLFPKHHIFPQALRAVFKNAGINIDDYAIRIPKALHDSIHGHRGGPWVNAWREFFKQNPNATAEEIHKYAGKLLYEFQIPGGPIIRY